MCLYLTVSISEICQKCDHFASFTAFSNSKKIIKNKQTSLSTHLSNIFNLHYTIFQQLFTSNTPASWHLSRGTDILVPNVRKGTGAIVSSSEEASPRPDRLPVEHLQGIVERVTFHSEESGYTVLRFNVPGERELVTVIGSFPEIHAGQTLRLTGYYREHPKYGRQFQCSMHRRPNQPPSPAWRNTWAVGSSKASARSLPNAS